MTEEYIIHKTMEYDKFSFDPTNRKIDNAKVKHLSEDIKKKNLLAFYPLVVTPNLVIRDGQHRFCAARILNFPFYYIVSADMSLQDVANASAIQSGWKSQDFLHHYCERGFVGYIALREFWHKNQWMTLEMAERFCYFGNHNHVADTFAAGEYMPNAIGFATTVANACLDFKEYVPYYNQISFMQTIKSLHQNKNYDHARMMRKMRYLSSKLQKSVNVEVYMQIFEAIYNYKESEENRFNLRKLTTKSPEYVRPQLDFTENGG